MNAVWIENWIEKREKVRSIGPLVCYNCHRKSLIEIMFCGIEEEIIATGFFWSWRWESFWCCFPERGYGRKERNFSDAEKEKTMFHRRDIVCSGFAAAFAVAAEPIEDSICRLDINEKVIYHYVIKIHVETGAGNLFAAAMEAGFLWWCRDTIPCRFGKWLRDSISVWLEVKRILGAVNAWTLFLR